MKDSLQWTCAAALAIALMLNACGGSGAESARADEEAYVPEVLPPHLAYRVEEADEALNGGDPDSIPKGMVNRLKAWGPEHRTLRVCFFDGKPALRKHIVEVASRWTAVPVGVTLDFGAAPAYRDCSRFGDNHIRIGFKYKGYWSLVGQDSYLLARQREQSMNFQNFLVREPSESEFNRVVLHEFGHALGFEHEHQHPWSRCNQEFNWEVINAELAKPPNSWSQEEIDWNMREQSADGKVLTQFDNKSIMLYTFPARYYKSSSGNACFSSGNTSLSPGDIALLAQVYPLSVDKHVEARAMAVGQYVDALKADQHETQKSVAALETLLKFTNGALPKDAAAGIPRAELPKEIAEAVAL